MLKNCLGRITLCLISVPETFLSLRIMPSFVLSLTAIGVNLMKVRDRSYFLLLYWDIEDLMLTR